MSALICGSMAFDTIMVFQDQFKNHILPEQVHILNVAFLVPDLRREFGGCAGNIAYNLGLLGGEGKPMGTVGTDFEPYAPSGNEPSAFIAEPLVTKGQIEVIVALQLPLSSINAIMQHSPESFGAVCIAGKSAGHADNSDRLRFSPLYSFQFLTHIFDGNESTFQLWEFLAVILFLTHNKIKLLNILPFSIHWQALLQHPR